MAEYTKTPYEEIVGSVASAILTSLMERKTMTEAVDSAILSVCDAYYIRGREYERKLIAAQEEDEKEQADPTEESAPDESTNIEERLNKLEAESKIHDEMIVELHAQTQKAFDKVSNMIGERENNLRKEIQDCFDNM